MLRTRTKKKRRKWSRRSATARFPPEPDGRGIRHFLCAAARAAAASSSAARVRWRICSVCARAPGGVRSAARPQAHHHNHHYHRHHGDGDQRMSQRNLLSGELFMKIRFPKCLLAACVRAPPGPRPSAPCRAPPAPLASWVFALRRRSAHRLTWGTRARRKPRLP